MSTVNANFSINNLPQIDRFHNEKIKAPLVDQAQKEQINQNERIHNLHRPVETQKSGELLVNQKKKEVERTRKKKENSTGRGLLKKNGKKREHRNSNGLFVDVEC
jgi:hypothetical protein